MSDASAAQPQRINEGEVEECNSRGRILLVDDEPVVLELLAEILGRAGFSVITAGDGEQAQAVLRSREVDLMVTDLIMPNLEGIETIQAVRRAHPGLKLIAMSGAFNGPLLKAARLLGADAALAKPINESDLLSSVNAVLAR